MQLLERIARYECVSILGLLVGVVLLHALTGRINLEGMLRDKVSGAFDPARLQLLVVTLLLVTTTLTQMNSMLQAGEVSLPNDMLLYTIGASEGLYLVRKVLQKRISLS